MRAIPHKLQIQNKAPGVHTKNRNKFLLYSLLQPSSTSRSLWPNDIFGNETDNAVQTLLHIYFRHQTLGQTGCLAVVGPSRDLSQASTRLMELNLQIREALSQAQVYQPQTTIVSTGL